MITFLKRVFNVVLLVGVVFSFFLRCSSQRVAENAPEDPTVESETGIKASRRDEVPKTAEANQQSFESRRQQVFPSDSQADTGAFRARTAAILNDLPTSESIRNMRGKEDHHETPSAIVASGKMLGEVMDQMRKNTANVETGLDFYKKCAGDSQIVIQIKALCLRNLWDWEVRLGKRSGYRVPKAVERLASQLPKTRF